MTKGFEKPEKNIPKQDYHNRTLAPGFWVALTIKKGIAPLASYVGEIQAVDEHGIRITHIDWAIGIASGYDFFFPWSNIEAATIATQEHDITGFGSRAEKWQNSIISQEEAHQKPH
ncbi:hypothetical protein LC653_18855 [Nostoc sp. CHAB 5784]|uniref:hypothetical protein n=1 Tax=Nostoc mirabile TaxID=2907820 RepID=UPI001E5DEB24|nr:hypothetical protein [Nostoc mirabile]MCC5665922.1 hypothetical protein [Nostoc mirabile CHAB5784]